MDRAVEIVIKADILVVVGTSLNVYPAAGLSQLAPAHAQVFLIDPGEFPYLDSRIQHIKKPATAGFKDLMEILLTE
jgi:NAD-dependent deacetylase